MDWKSQTFFEIRFWHYFKIKLIIKAHTFYSVQTQHMHTHPHKHTKYTHTKPPQITGRKEPDNLSPFGWISGDPFLHCLVPINLRQVRSSHTYTQSPTHDLSPVTTVTWLQRAETSFIRKPEARLWQSWGTARDWPLCIFRSSLAVTHPNCRGCQSLAYTPTPPPVWLYREGVTEDALIVRLIVRIQVKSENN